MNHFINAISFVCHFECMWLSDPWWGPLMRLSDLLMWLSDPLMWLFNPLNRKQQKDESGQISTELHHWRDTNHQKMLRMLHACDRGTGCQICIGVRWTTSDYLGEACRITLLAGESHLNRCTEGRRPLLWRSRSSHCISLCVPFILRIES